MCTVLFALLVPYMLLRAGFWLKVLLRELERVIFTLLLTGESIVSTLCLCLFLLKERLFRDLDLEV